MTFAHVDHGELSVTCRRLGVVMEPDGSPGEVEGVLNPGVVRDRHNELLLYPRMVAAGNVSSIGIARMNGRAVERLGIALEPQTPFEHREEAGGYGCEDARVTSIARLNRYVMTYTAFGPAGARIAIAVSDDAYTWKRLGLVRFADDRLNAVDNKDAAFFPDVVWSPSGVLSYAFFHRPMRAETINGQTPIALIETLPPHERESTCLAYVPVARVHDDIAALCHPTESIRVLDVGDSWGMLKNGAGTPPIRTPLGWLSVFHGVDALEQSGRTSLKYSAGFMINDLRSPHNIVFRSPNPVLVPETSAERFGTVDNVVFPTGIDEFEDGTFDVYYGAADAKISRVRFAPASMP